MLENIGAIENTITGQECDLRISMVGEVKEKAGLAGIEGMPGVANVIQSPSVEVQNFSKVLANCVFIFIL